MGRSAAELRVLGKGSKERTLPFLGNERARDAFHLLGFREHGRDKGRRLLWGQRGPLTASGIKQLLTPYGRAAGLDRFSAHVLRHTCARRMFERGEPVQVIARWMGHESLNTTFLYTLPSEADLAKAAGASGDGWADDDD
jgi:integrase/recombinase XerC